METQTELKTGNPINFSPSGIAYQRDSTDSFLWQFKNNQWIKSTSYGELLSSPPLSSATNRDKRVWSNDEEIKFIVTTEDRKCHEITDRLGSGWNIRSLGSYHWVVGRDTDDYPSLLRVSAGNNQILLELPDKRQVPIHEGPTLNAAPAHGYGRYLCTRQGKTWVAWTKDHNSVGTLSMISEVHHDTGEVAYTWPLGLAGFQSIEGRTESDVHNQPQVIVSPDNYIIVILGAHHGPLYMVKSVNPLSIEEGFWPMERIGIPSSHHRHGYTYPALQYDSNGHLHFIARWTGKNRNYFNDWRLIDFNIDTKDQKEIEHLKIDNITYEYVHWYHEPSITPRGQMIVVGHPLYRDHADDQMHWLEPRIWVNDSNQWRLASDADLVS